MGEMVQENCEVKMEERENNQHEETDLPKDEGPPIIDLNRHFIKPDQFDGIEVLDEKFMKIKGAPNFRQIPGFPVFGTGQPTEEGMVGILNQIRKETSKENIIWFSMRQEPIVYVNGAPYATRSPENAHSNIIIDVDNDQIKSVNQHLATVLKKRVDGSDKTLKIHVDKDFAENPLDRVDLEETVIVETIKDLDAVYDSCQKKSKVSLEAVRIPVMEDCMPNESCFDAIISVMKSKPASTPCVFSCQMGKGRTTVGMLTACLIKEIQLTTELKQMEADMLIKSETLKELLYEKFEKTLTVPDEDIDSLVNGNFEVIKQLCNTLSYADEAKHKLDIIIDKCGPPPGGVGIQNLRECIVETKWMYDVATEDKQCVFKAMIVNFIERYFYLVCFTTYSLKFGPAGYKKSFQEWMEDNKDLKLMASDGKDKLEWSRTVDAGKLELLKKLLNDPNYKDNLPLLIRTIFEFAYQTYSDLPRGPIKNNSMRKLAAMTLMEILPTEIGEKVAKKLEEDPHITHDFLSIVGLVSYF